MPCRRVAGRQMLPDARSAGMTQCRAEQLPCPAPATPQWKHASGKFSDCFAHRQMGEAGEAAVQLDNAETGIAFEVDIPRIGRDAGIRHGRCKTAVAVVDIQRQKGPGNGTTVGGRQAQDRTMGNGMPSMTSGIAIAAPSRQPPGGSAVQTNGTSVVADGDKN